MDNLPIPPFCFFSPGKKTKQIVYDIQEYGDHIMIYGISSEELDEPITG